MERIEDTNLETNNVEDINTVDVPELPVEEPVAETTPKEVKSSVTEEVAAEKMVKLKDGTEIKQSVFFNRRRR